MYHYHALIIESYSLDFRTTLQNLILRVSLWSEKKKRKRKRKNNLKGLHHLSFSPSLCLEHKESNKSACWNLPMWVMDALSLHVLTRVSSQMAPVRLLHHGCQVSMGSSIFRPASGARFLAGICQAPSHCPLDGEAQHSWRLCIQRGISRISFQQVPYWQAEAGEWERGGVMDQLPRGAPASLSLRSRPGDQREHLSSSILPTS